MSYSQILYDVEDGVLTITMNRPEKLNAFTGTMMTEMIDAFDRSDADDSIRAVIVTGAGRAFCAGADLAAGGATFDADGRADRPKGLNRDGGGLLTLRIFDSKKPVIAAVNGPAVGIGVTMTLAMDIRLAADVARFGFVFARRGIVPEACSSWFLPRVVGISRALEWAYSGRVFPAEEALEGGLVRSIHPKDQLLATARGLAREIADNTSAISVSLIRPDDVADARRRSSDGSAQARLARRVLHRPLTRRTRRRGGVPREASGTFSRKSVQGFTGVLSLVGRTHVRMTSTESLFGNRSSQHGHTANRSKGAVPCRRTGR
jgi:enoyl-CoA hydratase/carnithine racemase